MTWALGVLPVALLVMGFPIFIVLLASVSVALLFFMNVPYTVLHQTMFGALDSVALLAIPFFIYAGELMGSSSVARRLVNFVQAIVGPIPGNLAVTTVGTATVFGAISGASSASVATIGKVMLPALRAAKYPERMSAGLITAVGAIDIIIPPSIPMIVYGAAAQESVPRLYAAGVLPGLLIAGMLAVYVMWRAWRLGIVSSTGKASGFWPALKAARDGIWALGAPVIILGGIYGGIFSPTESAAVACIYAAFVTKFVYRDLGWRDIVRAASHTAYFTGQVLVIVACASVFSWLLTVNQVPAGLVTWIKAMNAPPWLFLLVVNILLLAIGCVLDVLSAILLLSPLLLPVVAALGIDPVHFGLVMMLNLAIGLFSPPFGINIFVAQSALGLQLPTIYRGIVPFLVIYLVALGLITYVPEISLFSMRLFMGQVQ